MTPEEARARVGSGVVYRPYPGGPAEDGEITEVRGPWVFVRYAGDGIAKATAPESLVLLHGGEEHGSAR